MGVSLRPLRPDMDFAHSHRGTASLPVIAAARQTRQVIVATGMHRSGTSLLSNILIQLGIDMGSKFRGPDSTQTDGYFEDIEWRDINSEILNRAGGTWYNVPDHEMIRIHAKGVFHRIESLIRKRHLQSSVGATWGFKDPRCCLTLHVLAPILAQPRVLIMRRDPVSVVGSLRRRAEVRGYEEPDEHWARLHRIYMDRLNLCLDQEPCTWTFVDYEHLTCRESAEDEIEKIARFAGIHEYNTERAKGVVRFRD